MIKKILRFAFGEKFNALENVNHANIKHIQDLDSDVQMLRRINKELEHKLHSFTLIANELGEIKLRQTRNIEHLEKEYLKLASSFHQLKALSDEHIRVREILSARNEELLEIIEGYESEFRKSIAGMTKQ